MQNRFNKKLKLGYKIINPTGVGVLFYIHGLGDSDNVFLKNVQESPMYKKMKILSINLPGCGVNLNKDMSFELMVRNIRSIIKSNLCNSENILIGHSLGGLALLLSCIDLDLVKKNCKIITIEPSITNPDYDFFSSIQEKPIGFGYKSVINFLKKSKDVGYIKTYLREFSKSKKSIIKKIAREVYHNFWSYRSLIDSAKSLHYFYIYGEDSSGISHRDAMRNNENVSVFSIRGADHWAHINCRQDFFQLMDCIKNRSM